MRHFHIFSADKDRKIAFWGSVIFMVLAWLVLAGGWCFIVAELIRESFKPGFIPPEWEAYGILSVYFFVVIMIPVQVRRYFRKKRKQP